MPIVSSDLFLYCFILYTFEEIIIAHIILATYTAKNLCSKIAVLTSREKAYFHNRSQRVFSRVNSVNEGEVLAD